MNEELIDETESKYTYTKIKPTTKDISKWEATLKSIWIMKQLVHCVKYNILFFCEHIKK